MATTTTIITWISFTAVTHLPAGQNLHTELTRQWSKYIYSSANLRYLDKKPLLAADYSTATKLQSKRTIIKTHKQ